MDYANLVPRVLVGTYFLDHPVQFFKYSVYLYVQDLWDSFEIKMKRCTAWNETHNSKPEKALMSLYSIVVDARLQNTLLWWNMGP
jgi:hypothetical protein